MTLPPRQLILRTQEASKRLAKFSQRSLTHHPFESIFSCLYLKLALSAFLVVDSMATDEEFIKKLEGVV